MRNVRAILCGVVLFFAGTAARAEDCKPLTLLTSLNIEHSSDYRQTFAPVTINGTEKLMLVDTGGWVSEVSHQAAAELQLPTRHAGAIEYGVAGTYTDETARVDTFKLGRVVAYHIDFMVDPDLDGDARVAGTIAPNILKYYDIEMDFSGGKLNLLSQDHCPGKVIYWPAGTVAAVPMRLARSGHIIVPVKLDGLTLQAMIDTGSTNTILSSRDAESDFGLKLGAADTPYAGPVQGTTDSATYKHVFKTLSFEGVTINNPELIIMPDLMHNPLEHGTPLDTRISTDDEQTGLEDVTIGMNELRHLHLYIAYKEQMLYITPASETATASSGGTTVTGSASP